MGVYVYTKPMIMKETARKIAESFGFNFYISMDANVGGVLLVIDNTKGFEVSDYYRFTRSGWEVIHLCEAPLSHLNEEKGYQFFETSDWSVDGLKTRIASFKSELNLA